MQKVTFTILFFCSFVVQAQDFSLAVLKTRFYTDAQQILQSHANDFEKAGITHCERYFWQPPEGHSIGDLDKLFILKVQNMDMAIGQASNWDWVEYIEPQYEHELLHIPNDSLPGFTRQQLRNLHWGHTNTKVYEAWDHSKGDTSIVIGIIDTGILPSHRSLKGQMAYNWKEKFGIPGVDDDKNGFVDDTLGYDFADWDNDPTQYQDHGTQVAGVASAIVDDNFGSFGVGFHCKIMPIKVQISRSPTSLRNIYRAIVYAAQNGCKIINLSLGRSAFPARHEQEIIDWVVANYDVLVVAAAGNSGKRENFLPASYRNVLSVVHSDWEDRRELQFNSTTHSPFIDLTAPGVNLFSTSSNLSVNQGHRGNITGSSFASPFTAAVAGLIWAKYPTLKAPQVAELIRATTDDTYQLSANKDYRELLGTGRLNALKAVTFRDSVQALRMIELNLKTNKFGYVSAGDTITINPVFVNYLNKIKSPFNLKLNVNSSFAQVLDSIISIDLPVAELDTAKSKKELRIVIASNCPAGQEILLRFEYNYPSRQDYQYHQIFVDRSGFGPISTNSWAILQRENGFLSQKGSFMSYKNKQMFKSAGLVLASADKVSLSFDTIQDFKPVVYADLNEFYDSMYSFSSSYFDSQLGIKVHQNTVSYLRNPNREFLILEYDLTNLSQNNYDTLYCGVLCDWDFGDSLVAQYSLSTQSLVVSNRDKNVVSSTLKTLNLFQDYSIINSFEKNNLISKINSKQTTFSDTNSITTYSGAKLLYFAPGQTRKVRFLLVGSDTASLQLEQSIQLGTDLSKAREKRMAKPLIMDSLFCNLDSMYISPKGGVLYSFNGFVAPLMRLLPTDTAKTIAITDLSGVFPSDTTFARFYHKGISVWFEPKTICQGDTFIPIPVIYSNIHSGNVEHRFSSDGNDFFEFVGDSAGKFLIQLKAKTSLGCQATFVDTILVVALPDTAVEVMGYRLRASPAVAYRWFLDGQVVGTEREMICRKPGFYTVELTGEYGCKSISAPIDMRIQGLDSETFGIVYPNPFNNKINISIPKDDFVAAYLYDEIGRELFATRETQIQTAHLARGIYLLKIETKQRILVFKMLKP